MSSKHEVNAVVVFYKNSEQTDALDLFLHGVRKGRFYLLCELVSDGSPHYLHVKARGRDDKKVWGNLLIPHSAICLVAYGGDRKTLLGFAREAS